MFWSSPSADMEIMLFLLVVSLAIAIAVYFFSKKLLWSIFAFSVLSNFAVYLNSGSRMFDIYDIKYIVSFTLHIWPYINMALFIVVVVTFFSKKYAK